MTVTTGEREMMAHRSSIPVLACLAGTACTLAGAPSIAASADASDYQLEEIVVTAERRAENIQKTPVSVSVISGEELAAQNRTHLDEILAGTAGVQLQQGPAGYIVNIRGVTNNAGGTADYVTAMYSDGVYTQLELESRAAFIDLNRVEVLRGPQGTLYGGNALGGAVNIISNDPDLQKYQARARLSAGNYSMLGGEAVLNVPLTGSSALRAVVASENREGFLANGQDDSVYSVGRLKYRYSPSDQLNIVLSASYTKVGGHGAGTVHSSYPEDFSSQSNPWFAADPVVDGIPLSARTEVRLTSYRASVDWNVGFGTLTLLPAWTDVLQKQDAAPFGPPVSSTLKQRRPQAEVRLNSLPDSAVKWTVGAFYLHYNTPLTISIINGPSLGEDLNRYTTYAGFGQVTVPVTTAFRVTGGLRYTHASKDSQGFFDLGFARLTEPGSFSAGKTTWKAGVEADLAEHSLLYANVSEGFRVGGVIGGGGTFTPGETLPTFDSETMTAYEIGSKNEFLDRRALLNAEVFYYDYGNYQVADTFINGAGLQLGTTDNVQGVKSYGGEIEAHYLPTPADDLEASVAYLHARFGTQTGVAQKFNIDGDPLDHSPDWTLHLAYQHTWTLGSGSRLTAAVDGNYTTKQRAYFATDCYALDVPCEQEAYHLSNARLAWNSADDRWTATAWIRNIEDYAVMNANQGPPGLAINVGQPRTYGLTLSLKLDVAR